MSSIPPRNKTTVAPSLELSGQRRGIFPLRMPGRYARKRRVIAWILIPIYFVIPWLRFNGKSLLLLDFSRDEFWVFFQVWRRTDAIYFLTVPLLALLTLFISTTLKGRIWCGYACPQTVFLEWIIRPIEEFFEGNAYKRKNAHSRPANLSSRLRKLAKHLAFAFVGAAVGNTALMYFYGPTRVLDWMHASPVESSGPFFFMLLVSGLFYLDFSWFREQFCSFVCPYARIQSVLMDSSSPTAHYHEDRGEPRGKRESTGDCINCGLCVRVCPTGIDIRDGLQLECIQCLRCVDACNTVMASLKKAPNLIEFTAPEKPTKNLQVRSVFYGFLILLTLAVCVRGLMNRPALDFVFFRQGRSSVVSYGNGQNANIFQIRLVNTLAEPLPFTLGSESPGTEFICGQCQQDLGPFESRMASLVAVYSDAFSENEIKGVLKYAGQTERFRVPLIKNQKN